MAATIPEVETSTKVSKKVTDNEGHVATCEATTSEVPEKKPVDPERYVVLHIRTGGKIYIPKNWNNPEWVRKWAGKQTRPRRAAGKAQQRQQTDSETGGK